MNAIRKNATRGFTLVEILIVVIILGILAAIVIPQFTNASTDARRNSTSSLMHTLRSQIELYKIQHGDNLPDLVTNWEPLTKTSTYAGTTFGPYMQQTPKNPLNGFSVVVNGDGTAAPAASTGFVYDRGALVAGKYTGTGKIWATSGATGAAYFNEANPAGADLATAP